MTEKILQSIDTRLKRIEELLDGAHIVYLTVERTIYSKEPLAEVVPLEPVKENPNGTN